MGRGGTSPCLILRSSAERAPLAHWQRSTTLQAGLATRGHIILWRADGLALAEMARCLGVGRWIGRQWLKRGLNRRLAGLSDKPGRGRQPGFPPAVAVPLVQMACARPDTLGRSLAPWDGLERARPLEHDGRVEHRSAATVRRLRAHHQRQPWRAHRWRSPTTPRDAECWTRVAARVDLYPRALRHDDSVLCPDAQTARPPRPRRHAPRPATSALPQRVEPEDRRAGALPLWAAFDPRTGQVYGPCEPRQRPRAFLAC